MIATGKVFTTGNSQAIRLHKAFRVTTTEVWITKSGNGGGMNIQPKPSSDDLESFFAELRAMPVSDEFIPPRDDAPAPSPFEDWVA
jgi:antitoxin VapB